MRPWPPAPLWSRRSSEETGAHLPLREVHAAALRGDARAERVIRDGAHHLGRALASANAAPRRRGDLSSAVGVAEIGETYLAEVRRAYRAAAMPGPSAARVVPAQLGIDAALTGAALLGGAPGRAPRTESGEPPSLRKLPTPFLRMNDISLSIVHPQQEVIMNNAFPSNPFGGNSGSGNNGGPGGLFGGAGFGTGPGGPASAIFEAMDQLRKSFRSPARPAARAWPAAMCAPPCSPCSPRSRCTATRSSTRSPSAAAAPGSECRLRVPHAAAARR